MKKILPIVVVGIFVLSGLGAVAIHSENNLNSISWVNFSQPIIQDKNQYVTIDIDNANSNLMVQDKPMLPSYIETFTYPFGTEIKSVTCTPHNIQQQTIPKEIIPTPEAVPVSFGAVESEEQEVDGYNGIGPYPDKWYEYDVGCGRVGKDRRIIVKVQVFPVQYHPIRNMIEWASNVEIKVGYELPTQPVTFNDQYALIVLAPSQFQSSLNSLISHKNNNMGLSTKFVSLDDIYNGVYFPVEGRDNQEKIKYFIKNAYDEWGTTYVLLVGGSDEFPTRETHIKYKSDTEVFVTDLYYADIYDDEGGFCSWDADGDDTFGEYDWESGCNDNCDEVDLYPDVYIGRLACVNGGEVTTAVNKIKTYEINEAYGKDWFKKLVAIGGDSVTDDNEEINEGEYVNQAIIDILSPEGFTYTTLWASEGDLSGWVPPGATKISNAINSGCGFVDFSGHGNWYVWATHPPRVEGTWLPTELPHGDGYWHDPDVKGLQNGNKLPIVIVGACSTAKYNKKDDTFCWMFIRNSGGGGIAVLGATGLGYVYYGSGSTEGLIEGLAVNTFEAYVDGATTFGEMWGQAIKKYIDTHNMKALDFKTVEEWQPFGDPSLAIAGQSQPPLKPSKPDGPAGGQSGEEYTYTTSTTDPDGDDVYYQWDWDDGPYSTWKGPYESGDTAEASHTWSSDGTYEIRVRAMDTHGIISEWSDPKSVSMPTSYNSESQQSQSSSSSSSGSQSSQQQSSGSPQSGGQSQSTQGSSTPISGQQQLPLPR